MRIGLSAMMIVVAASTSAAQRVSGTVRASGTSAVLSGVVVTTVDTAGKTLARTLSNSSGRYSLPIAPTAVRVRAVRIGFRPVTRNLVSNAGDVTIDLAMEHVPVVLETVRVKSDATCDAAQNGQYALDAWEQARSALLAAIVAREANPAQVRLLEYQRRMQRTRRLITEQRLSQSSGQSRRPVIAARSAADLAQYGYMSPVDNDRLYYAPDADVLFDESFGATHCFGVTRGTRDRAGQIGLTFKPREIRRDFVDVNGTLWLDPKAPALLDLEYRYTGMSAEAERGGAGGTMHFSSMPNGVVFIDSWSILVPTVTEVRERGYDGNLVSRGVIDDLVETGGYVLQASWPDGTTWSEPLGGVRGSVKDKAGATVADVEISTPGAAGRTGAAGAYALLPLPPGRYELSLLDTAFSAYTRPRTDSREIVVERGDTAVVDFEVPSRESVLGDICRTEPKAGNTVVLLGKIDDGGAIPDELRVEALWYGSPAGSSSIDLTSVNQSTQITQVNSAGAFYICGIPRRSSRITLVARLGRVTVADTSLVATSELPGALPTRHFDWTLPPGSFAAALRGDAAVLSGRVTRNGQPVAGAEVWLVFSDTTVKTDSTGHFRIAGLNAGQQLVQVRRIGYAVKRDTVVLKPREETRREFVMDGAQLLDTMRTVGAGRAYSVPRLQEFEKRRLSGMGGYFVSEDDLRANENVPFSSVLRSHVPGARIENVRGQAYLISRTPGNFIRDLPKGCYATVFVDGLIIYDGPSELDSRDTPPDLNQFLTSGLSGVEFYRGGAALPVQFRSRRNECGTLLLWTRGK